MLMQSKNISMANASTIMESDTLEPKDNQGGMSAIHTLAQNYHEIIRMQAIYYPVAYRFGNELGRGRQGIVFSAYRHGARGCVTRHAIKLFDPQLYKSAKQYWTDMGRIAAQISKLQNVNSPNLSGRDVYEESNGIGYVQMEAIDGVDIQNLLYGSHFAKVHKNSTRKEWHRFSDVIFRFESERVLIQPGIVLYIMRQILRGLEVLHKAGFVHSDVKPANVMVDKLGLVKLIDYGRATSVHEKVRFLFGTPLYMAPEIHLRQESLPQSDIYSVGLVGLELLRGEPLLDTTTYHKEKDLLNFKLELPSRLTELLPDHVTSNEEFVRVLERFLDPNPANRYQTAEDAESTSEGLAILHKQLALLGKDTEYDRELASYLTKLYEQ